MLPNGGSTSSQFTLTVTLSNMAPVFGSTIAHQYVRVGEELTIDMVEVTDPDGDDFFLRMILVDSKAEPFISYNSRKGEILIDP